MFSLVSRHTLELIPTIQKPEPLKRSCQFELILSLACLGLVLPELTWAATSLQTLLTNDLSLS